jgi:excisionase family DNA binding protein
MRTWWTTAEAAVHAACSVKTIVRAAQRGHLRHVRLAGNRRFRFRPAWVDAWLLGAAPADAVRPATEDPCGDVDHRP